MKRRHTMPFGAERAADGATRFSLWAPAARAVTLELARDGAAERLALRARAGGWFERTLADVPVGARYAYRIDDRLTVPDPASRANPDDVHAPSAVVDPDAYDWQDAAWRGRPWHEAVIYELHVGTFTPAGTFAAAIERLPYLATLGVTAIELMPLADFPGARNWGYDGVLPFAPDASYGPPEALKRLIDAAHAHRIMVFIDVVINHFGPEGNYLGVYAPPFFDPRHHTPWGGAIGFAGPHATSVREFFAHVVLYWLEEFHADGIRLDAVHAIYDASPEPIVAEIARRVRAGPGRERHVHLVLENDRNEARWLAREAGRAAIADAQWNDDVHHAWHVIATGEADGYYADYADEPLALLGRALAGGFAFQGERSAFRGDRPRGERSAHLPPVAFVDFLQTHDQIGNRARGERIGALAPPERLRLALECVLLAPHVPMLFMGEEFAASTPFPFFCDFGPDLARAVKAGREREFAAFAAFAAGAERLPDATDPMTFVASKLRWDELEQAPHRDWLAFYRELIALRHAEIVPLLPHMHRGGYFRVHRPHALVVAWPLVDGRALQAAINAGPSAASIPRPNGRVIRATGTAAGPDTLAPWSARWTLQTP